MKKRFSKKPLFLLLAALMALPHPLLATTYAPEEFNPDFILSDEEMQDWRSLNRTDIQAFLDAQGGKIANMKHTAEDGKKRTTTDIIYRAAKEHQINPKYLLVKLQKEQSLITAKNPTEKQVNWATGYAVCDSCKTTDPDIQNNKGFGTQVDKAAGIIRWYYDNKLQEPWIKRQGKTYTIDTVSVRPKSDATGFLYTYTPHIHGNKNFWILWQRWFDQVYPDGTLMKTADSPDVYLIADGKRRKFGSFTALTSRFDPKSIVTVPESELARYTLGSDISLPNFAILNHNGKHYLVDYDRLRPFESADVVRDLGYHPDEILVVSGSDIAEYPLGPAIKKNEAPTGQLIRLNEDGMLYFVQAGTMHPLVDDAVATINFPHLTETRASFADLGEITTGEPVVFKDGTLILIEGSNEVYVIEHGKKRHIASEEVFTGLGFSWENIVRAKPSSRIYIPTGEKMYLRRAVEGDESHVLEEDESDARIEDLMQRTPEEDWTFTGPEFNTDVDAYLVADAEGNILAGKNIDVVRPTASLTKVMTGYRLLYEGLKMSGSATYEAADHKGMYHRFRIAEGEKVKNRDLFDASLISSLNTATRMLVDEVEENESAFVKRMNDHAIKLGLEKTRFVDVTGEREENVTTAREYLALFQKATTNGTLKANLKKRSYEYDELKDLDGKPNHFDTHTNALRNRDNLSFTVGASKTGYLYESGANLAMTVTRKSDRKVFTIITLGNVDFQNRFDEPEALAEWTMEKF